MLNLTKQERQIILFLSTLALLGIGIDFCMKRCAVQRSVSVLADEVGKWDVNKADKRMLMDVPGIGEKIAARIIEERNKNQGFKDMEELKKVKGMTAIRYERIKEAFVVKR